MREMQKSVFYCDHCGKHGLSRHHMVEHEKGCTSNPERVCGWHQGDVGVSVDIAAVARALLERSVLLPVHGGAGADERSYLTKEDIDWLHDEVAGCPACMLAALRQSGVWEWHHDHDGTEIFSYEKAVEQVIVAEIDKVLRKELQDAVTEAKGQVIALVREKASEVIAETIQRAAKGTL